jgi:RND family efflux transporter MFP subunit
MDTTMNPLEILKSRRYLLGAVAISGILLAVEWNHLRGVASSPVAAPAVRAASARVIRAEGRVVTYPGAEVVVGTDVGGRLRALPVTEKMRVKKGDLVAEIDADEQKAALAEARRRVAEAEVDMKYFETELTRSQHLAAANAIATATVDRSAYDRDGARARHDVAVATAQRLATIVGKTRIVAPIDGTVISRPRDPGETVAAGAELVTIADLDKTRIEAEIDEYDAGRIALGSPVKISAEGYGASSWKGHVEEIPDAVTSRRLKPQDPARPSDTRVLLVKVALDAPIPVKLGQRVEVEVDAERTEASLVR